MKGLLGSFLFLLPALHIVKAAYAPPELSSPNNSTVDDSSLVVDLGYAKYQGVLNETSSNVRFLGIRYAKSPAGSLRWKVPQTPDAVAEVQIADTQPPKCPQTAFGFADTSPFRNSNPNLSKRDEGSPEDEDCLFLNVFVPGSQFNKTSSEETLPVIVWIHGGGYNSGSSSDTGFPNTTGIYDGEDLIRIGDNRVIVVVIQYRLGLFGFLAGGKVRDDGALNAGLLDQQFALQWVRQHVSKFNGDPSRVVLWGQSAGAGSVLNHIIANDGKTDPPLFHGGILSSHFLPAVYNYNDSIPEALYTQVVNQSNCSDAQDTLNCLRETDLDVLSAAKNQIAASGFFGTFAFSPVVDGTFITQRPLELLAQGKLNKVEKILAITNSFEGTIFTDPNATDLADFAGNIFPTLSEDTAAAAAALYANPTMSAVEIAAQIYSEWVFICPTYSLLEAHPNSSYKGQFAIPPALHGDDIYYYFASLRRSSPPKFQNEEFQKAFTQGFLAFATSENLDPNDKFDQNVLPQWPLWDSRNSSEMLFNRTEDLQPIIEVVNSNQDLLNRCRFWKNITIETSQ
ncbi:hypothetical protein D9758_004574 [Tetrapyrgos nigripes]|uniref:Carboxylesterase type B domain-containing protein n=1 Tax=Tetrapyrgos nigripes TaxID=182062 RepID=A0A8H5LYQ1_9AGAR|nr:hypothetical protein D9758_004574 [Tetrapyrgos nigripes]